MITRDDYFMGRDRAYPLAMTPEIERNAARTIGLVNKLLERAILAGVWQPIVKPKTGSLLADGWRSPEVNAATKNAAPTSKHMLAKAADVYDPEGDLDEWLLTPGGHAALEELGLWLEHPSATKTWCHVQTEPPRSGRRVFYP
jgi:hypothetical protein